MPTTQPRERIESVGRQVALNREDVEAWKPDHDALATDCWAWEDLVATANFLFEQIMRQDVRVQRYIPVERGHDGTDLQDELRRILLNWTSGALRLVPRGDRLQREYDRVEGLDVLRENLSKAKSILTPR